MWGHNKHDFQEIEPLDCELPERSLLYRIPAMESGTGQAEGLLSYLVRVARAHSVNPRRLVRVVFADNNPEFSKLKSAGFFIRHAGTINGLSQYAELFAGEMAKLTGAEFLKLMCLLPLQGLLPSNGAGLLARNPKWCASCIGEMMQSGEDAFRPLAWSFELYRVCVRHRVQLHEACSHCGKLQPFIPRYPDWGRCDHCGWRLDAGDAKKVQDKLEHWVSSAIEDLVAHLNELDRQENVKKFQESIRAAVTHYADGNRARFCELVGFPRWALTGWLSHGERPTLPQLLSICYGLNIMPSTLLMNGAGEAVFSKNELRAVPNKLMGREERPLLGAEERRRLAKELGRIVKDTGSAKPLSDIAKSLGLTRSCLKYWFPEECATILDKHKAARKAQTEASFQQGKKLVMEVVSAIRARGEYPSRRRVNAALREHNLLLARKNISQAYREAVNNGAE